MAHDLSKAELRRIISDRDSIEKNDFFVLRLHLVPNGSLTLEQAAIKVLLIISGRTMYRLPYEPAAIRASTSGHIVEIDEKANVVEIALPAFLCESEEGLTHLMTLVTSAAEYSYCDEYWLENIELPRPFVEKFRGPRFGVDGIRHLFRGTAAQRPLVGVILKPRRGVALEDVLPHIMESLLGGCDFVADDLLLVDPSGPYSLRSRVPQLMRVVKQVETETKLPKAYFANVGTNCGRAAEIGKWALDAGATGLIANAFTMGFGSFGELVDSFNGRAPIITSNMGGGILTRPRLLEVHGKPTGVSEIVVSKFSRLAGADAVHAGTSASECYGSNAWGPATRALQFPFFDRKPCFAVAEGDLNVANLWENIKSLRRNVMLEPTSGILAAPSGPRKAAQIFRALSEQLSDEMTESEAQRIIMEFANTRKDLGVKALLDHFGFKPTHHR